MKRLRHPVLALCCALSVVAQVQAQQMPESEDKSEAVESAQCPAQLQLAEATLERGRAATAAKAWKDAAALLREAGGVFLALASCPAEAPQARKQGEKAGQELQAAEAQLQLHGECLPRMDKALDQDIRAATLRSGNGDPAEIERQLASAETLWRDAAALCQSPQREKAERSLAATVRARAVNAELLSAGPACDAAWKNATTLGELAKGAWKDKRWDDAGMLYSKAGLAWEGAADKCSGTRQQLAQRKIEQTQTDAHNAEFCGPLWDAATELSQRARTGAASAGASERDVMSVKAEVAWREAAAQCKGSPQSLARSNADALSRERGAPLPPQAMLTYGHKVLSASVPATAPPAPAAVLAPVVVPVPGSVAGSGKAVALPLEAVKAAPAAKTVAEDKVPPPVDPNTPPGEIVAGDTTYRGQFVIDPVSGAVSGSGNVSWSNGERFTGTLVSGRRHGRGRFDWVGGQWYDGDWQDGRALGQGVIQFVGGNRYTGAVVDGEPQGRGSLIFTSGDRYNGDFVRGIFHGQGSYLWKNGNRYEGTWNFGKKHGQGRLIWPDGDGWEGEFRDDQQTDNGKDIVVK